LYYRSGFVSLLIALAASASADALFPIPIHLTRQVHDSIGGKTVTVEQYCYGDRVVSVNGARTTVADYGKGELTEIDRQENTYSVTRFEDVAKALRGGAPAAAADSAKAAKPEWKFASSGLEADLDEGTTKRHTRVAVDRKVSLSKDALDVLIGAAYPNNRKAEDEVVLKAAKGPGAYALPVEQQTTFIIGDTKAEVRDVVLRVGDEIAGPDLITIPPDAKLVESPLLRLMRAMEELESAGRAALPRK